MSLTNPFFKVYFKCDHEVYPSPPQFGEDLFRNLIRGNHSHVVNQSMYPTEEYVKSQHGFVFSLLDNLPLLVPCSEYINVSSDFLCIQTYDDDVVLDNSEIDNWRTLYNL
jgi:hypothetical protein